jgi:putative non-specific serine/threonine protein kinase
LRLALSLDDEGEPIYSRGSYSVVFKAHSERNEREEWAIKCYVAEQERRIPSCRAIAQQLNSITSPYLLPMRLYEEELRIGHTYYPLVLLPWVEGKSLVREVDCHRHSPERLLQLSQDFGHFAYWLRSQPFAHGDLKSDNLRIRPDGSIVLLDYDGIYLPSMQGELPREEGNPDYTHPLCAPSDFNLHASDFALAVIALSLRALALAPELFSRFGGRDHLLLSAWDFRHPKQSPALKALKSLPHDAYLARLLDLFFQALERKNLAHIPPQQFLPL